MRVSAPKFRCYTPIIQIILCLLLLTVPFVRNTIRRATSRAKYFVEQNGKWLFAACRYAPGPSLGAYGGTDGCRYQQKGFFTDPRLSPSQLPETYKLTALTDPCQNGKEHCVVAFGIYGDDPFYLSGGLRNIMLGRHYWPGWKLRFYTDGSLPQAYIDQLTTETSDVHVVQNVSGKIAGMFWRLFVASDPTVDRFAVRDIDSCPGSRERAAMDHWILSGRQYHVFRDAPVHAGWPIVGCCWGAAKSAAHLASSWKRTKHGVLPYSKVEGLIRSGRVNDMMKHKGGDQDFLMVHIWPLITGQDLISHDSYRCMEYPSTVAWPTKKKGPADMAQRICSDGGGVGEIDAAQHIGEFDASKFELEVLVRPFTDNYQYGHCPIECRPKEHLDWIYC